LGGLHNVQPQPGVDAGIGALVNGSSDVAPGSAPPPVHQGGSEAPGVMPCAHCPPHRPPTCHASTPPLQQISRVAAVRAGPLCCTVATSEVTTCAPNGEVKGADSVSALGQHPWPRLQHLSRPAVSATWRRARRPGPDSGPIVRADEGALAGRATPAPAGPVGQRWPPVMQQETNPERTCSEGNLYRGNQPADAPVCAPGTECSAPGRDGPQPAALEPSVPGASPGVLPPLPQPPSRLPSVQMSTPQLFPSFNYVASRAGALVRTRRAVLSQLPAVSKPCHYELLDYPGNSVHGELQSIIPVSCVISCRHALLALMCMQRFLQAQEGSQRSKMAR
jgi:hypothetical protein